PPAVHVICTSRTTSHYPHPTSPTRRSSDLKRETQKIFMVYSDVTISHLFCHKAGVFFFYGPAILTDFAENVEMDPYTIETVNRTLFSNEMIGEVQPAIE